MADKPFDSDKLEDRALESKVPAGVANGPVSDQQTIDDRKVSVDKQTAVEGQAAVDKQTAVEGQAPGLPPGVYDGGPSPEPPSRDAGTAGPSRLAPGPETMIDPGRAGQVYRGLMHPLNVLEPVALVLSGGGVYGAFEVGALDFIYTQFMGTDEGAAAGFARPRPDIVAGTSIGAINGLWIAQGDGSIEDLKNLWFGLRQNEDMFELRPEFRDLLPETGPFLPRAIDRVLGDFGWAMIATAFIPLGFLLFGGAATGVANLYATLMRQPSVYELRRPTKDLRDREPFWSPTGPGLRGAGLSVTRDELGHRIVFMRGYDDMLYVRWQRDTEPISVATHWTSWEVLGGPISSDPVA